MSLKEFWEARGWGWNISRDFIITGFYELPAEHIKAEYLWTSLEFSDTNYSGTFTEPYPQGGD